MLFFISLLLEFDCCLVEIMNTTNNIDRIHIESHASDFHVGTVSKMMY